MSNDGAAGQVLVTRAEAAELLGKPRRSLSARMSQEQCWPAPVSRRGPALLYDRAEILAAAAAREGPTARVPRPETATLRAAYRSAGSLDRLGAVWGVAGDTARRWMLEAGLPLRGQGQRATRHRTAMPAPSQADLIAALERQGSVAALATYYSVSVSTAYRWLRARDVATPQASTAQGDREVSRSERAEH